MRLKGVSCSKKTLEDFTEDIDKHIDKILSNDEDYSIKYAKSIITNSGRADDNPRYCQVFKF